MPLPKSEIANRIHDEHDYLKKEMRKIRSMMNCEVSAEDFPKWRMDFMWLLRDFSNDLQKHFDLEEEGGFMSDVIRLAPQHLPAVERLEAQHRTITANLNQVIDALKGMTTLDSTTMQNICKNVDDLLIMLAEHEAAEGDIMETTFLLDYGGGD